MYFVPSKRSSRFAAIAVASALVFAACGGDDDDADGKASDATDAAPAASDAPAGSDTSAAPAGGDGDVGVSLILKARATRSSSPWRNQRKHRQADAIGVTLTVAAGQEDGDTQSQIAAIEAAVARGDKGILITPSGDAVVPALDAARAAGLFHDRTRHTAQPGHRRRHHLRY